MTTNVVIPFTTAFVGTSVFVQDVIFETDSSGNPIAISANNGLTLTIGLF